MSEHITYGDYLALDQLLSLQVPRSEPPHPDEMLFIVVHQASELWFKAIIHEIDGLADAFRTEQHGQILWRIQRINALMRIVSSQLSSLETLPPQHFAQFRTYLGSSSGSQSLQFRIIEAAAGLRDEQLQKALAAHSNVPAVRRALERPTIETLFLDLLKTENVRLEDLYLGPGPQMLFFIAEALLAFEQQFGEWRFKHVQLVERIIGPRTVGTGGSSGSRHLMSTIDQKFFPELWAVRAKFFGRS